MEYITTTNLRTQTSQLVDALKKGGAVSLIHRSKIVGVIKPKKQPRPLIEKDIKQLKKLAKELKLQKLSYRQRETIYREHLTGKYGKGLS